MEPEMVKALCGFKKEISTLVTGKKIL